MDLFLSQLIKTLLLQVLYLFIFPWHPCIYESLFLRRMVLLFRLPIVHVRFVSKLHVGIPCHFYIYKWFAFGYICTGAEILSGLTVTCVTDTNFLHIINTVNGLSHHLERSIHILTSSPRIVRYFVADGSLGCNPQVIIESANIVSTSVVASCRDLNISFFLYCL